LHYLDHNATTPPLAEAIEAAASVAKRAFGNPSSVHAAGRAARRALEDARERFAAFVGTEPASVVFTSGGTEANNLAIHSALFEAKGGRIVCSAIEHPSVLRPLERWSKRFGFKLVKVRPERNGRIDPVRFLNACTEDTRLACLMWANNETGVIQPVFEVAEGLRARGIPLLVDAVQALGKLEVRLDRLGADFVSFSAHKVGGLKGTGVLVVRRGVRVVELAPGGGQERGRRSGTENVPGAVAFATALGKIDFASLRPLRDRFEQRLRGAIPEAVVFGEQAERLPNTSMVGIPGLDGETLLMQLDLAGFAVSAGSACSSGKHEPSHVLAAQRADPRAARGAIRISLGPGITEAAIDALVDEIVKAKQRLEAMAGVLA